MLKQLKRHSHAEGVPHPQNCSGDCNHCAGDPREEAIAVLNYMISHNTAHANELAKLADRIRAVGGASAYEQVLSAMSDYEKGNMRLTAVLSAIR